MKKKCKYCNKKLPLIYFTCKCNNLYCIKHQLPHVHNCNYDYKDLSIIWYENIKLHNLNNYIIICADNETYQFLNNININCKLDKKNTKDTFWQYRIKIIVDFFNNTDNDYID